MPKKTNRPELTVKSLGFGNTDHKAVSVEEFDYEAFEIVLPPITYAVIKDADYAHTIFAKDFSEEHWNGLTEEERDEAIEKFRQSDMYDDWSNGYAPMMLYYWPLFMHGKDATKVAALLDQYAPAVTLLEIRENSALREMVGEDYALVFNGGGMDLSDHLAIAYICAGAVPPVRILGSAIDCIDSWRLPPVKKALASAIVQAEEGVRMDLNRLQTTAKALRKKARKPVAA